jgi:hypothetical protein
MPELTMSVPVTDAKDAAPRTVTVTLIEDKPLHTNGNVISTGITSPTPPIQMHIDPEPTSTHLKRLTTDLKPHPRHRRPHALRHQRGHHRKQRAVDDCLAARSGFVRANIPRTAGIIDYE